MALSSTDQEKNISGMVLDNNGIPIIGANVLIKGTTVGTITDVDGKFSLDNVSETSILVVSYMGYHTLEVSANQPSPIKITLKEDQHALDEVIVIGYGTMKKSDVTGAISTVSEEKLSRQPVANVSSALQGLATGVSVTSNSGSPGSASTIRIRGVGTVNDAEPLFVVDGMPVTDINYLSTSDIQSMEILKDASASAIYGSRGANGVILITTKKGTSGKTTISFDAYWGTSKIINNLDLMSGPEWYDYQTELNKIRNAPIDLGLVDRNVSTNWMDEISQTAFMHNYNVGISGGRANDYKFNIGLNYISQEGTIKRTNYERFNVRQSSEKTVVKDYLVVGSNISLAKSNAASINEFTSSGIYDADYGVISNAIRLDPVTPARNDDGSYGYSPYIDYYNPLASVMYGDRTTEKFAAIGNIYGELQIIKGLKFRSSFGAEIRRSNSKTFTPVYQVSNSQKNLESSLSKTHINGDYYTFENTLSYDKTFAKKHTISAIIGYTNEWGRKETLGVGAKDLIGESENLQYVDATLDKNKTTGSNNATEYGLISYLGRVHYDYADKYLITATFRRDGSSKFSKKNRWGNFPSFALGWRIDSEEFFKKMKADWISSLKLRAGWGQIGNQNITDYVDRSLLSLSTQYGALFGPNGKETLYQGIAVRRLGNPDIKWETTESWNLGIDASFFNSKLMFSFEYYYKTTKDMLLAAPMPLYMGYYDQTYTNIGEANNRGVELNLEWRDRTERGFEYSLGLNLSTIRNRMTKLNGGTPISDGSFRNGSLYITYTNEGMPIGAFWGYKTNGLIQTQEQLDAVKKPGVQPNAELGDVLFVDTNGDGLLDENDKCMIGNPIPDVIYGFNVSMAWKGFDLSLQFGGTLGNEVFNAMRLYTYYPNDITNKDRALLNYWTPENTNTDIPRLTDADVNDNDRISDRYVENGSYLRLRNAQLGYTLPSSIAKKMKMQNVRFYVSGQNIFTISNYSGLDVEVGQSSSLSRGIDYGIYPQAMTFTGGINITF
ncbi:TonB-dependent receptor [uncultured Phocaeicola sp.]|uniref:SusC/RagA family TonB-linked outer membrane protein n=1 Tax=uncultured Phocaeicola sp. TaxID=990718 RepID=UPI003453360E